MGVGNGEVLVQFFFFSRNGYDLFLIGCISGAHSRVATLIQPSFSNKKSGCEEGKGGGTNDEEKAWQQK